MTESHRAPPAADKKLLRPESVAEVLDISQRTLRTWISTRKFPKPDLVMGEKLKFWRIETVEAWIEARAR
jgi:predicted DNA-binding transcriptional regulator AlpA